MPTSAGMASLCFNAHQSNAAFFVKVKTEIHLKGEPKKTIPKNTSRHAPVSKYEF